MYVRSVFFSPMEEQAVRGRSSKSPPRCFKYFIKSLHKCTFIIVRGFPTPNITLNISQKEKDYPKEKMLGGGKTK